LPFGCHDLVATVQQGNGIAARVGRDVRVPHGPNLGSLKTVYHPGITGVILLA
jgi:hypothetical protein